MMEETITDYSKQTPGELICEQALKEWTGYQRKGALRRWLCQNNIKFFEDRSICTTASAINRALHGESENDMLIEFESDGAEA